MLWEPMQSIRCLAFLFVCFETRLYYVALASLELGVSSGNLPAIVSPSIRFKVCHHTWPSLEVLILDKTGNK